MQPEKQGWLGKSDGKKPYKLPEDVKAIIQGVLNTPSSGSYFDPQRGYVTPDDDYESNTHQSIKDIIAALNKGGEVPNSIYDAVVRLLYKYQVFVKQGVREDFGKPHKGVSWYLTDGADRRALISYQDGPHAEWLNGCFSDEVPLWLLLGLFKRIQRRKPLGDQDTDDTIKRVDELDTAYERHEQETERDGLTVLRHPSYFRGPNDDE